MKKIITILLVLVLALSLFAGCQKEEASFTLTDRAGNQLTVESNNFEKIVSFAPSITEVLVDLGLGDKIIAVTTVDNTPGLKEGISKFDFMKPDIEALIALDANLLLASSMTLAGGADDPFAPLAKVGVTVAFIPTSPTISDIYLDIEFYGKLFGLEKESDKIATSLKSEIAKIEEIGKTIKEKKSVYFEISAAPYMYSTGSGTYLHEMIEIVGATNVLGDVSNWTGVSDEQILSRNPSVILTNVNYIPAPIDEIKGRNGWDALDAVKNSQIFSVDNNATSLANHNILKGLKEMAAAVYPEYYSFG